MKLLKGYSISSLNSLFIKKQPKLKTSTETSLA